MDEKQSKNDYEAKEYFEAHKMGHHEEIRDRDEGHGEEVEEVVVAEVKHHKVRAGCVDYLPF